MQRLIATAWLPRLALCAVFTAAAIPAAFAQAPLKIGTHAGPYEDITNAAAQAAKNNGIVIQPVVLDGVVSANEMVAGGDLDGTASQHVVYLNTEIKKRGYKLIKLTEIYTVPLAIFSTKHKTLADIPDGGTFAVPNDETNQSRALLAMQDNGLIKLRADFNPETENATVLDVAQNPRHLKLVEISTPILASSLPDVDAGAVNANFAFSLAKLTLAKALGVENPERTKRYTQILVIRAEDKDKPWVQPLINSYHSPEVRAVIETKFKDVMQPAF